MLCLKRPLPPNCQSSQLVDLEYPSWPGCPDQIWADIPWVILGGNGTDY